MPPSGDPSSTRAKPVRVSSSASRQRPVYSAFLNKILHIAGQIESGTLSGQVGSMTMESQVKILEEQIEDAYEGSSRRVWRNEALERRRPVLRAHGDYGHQRGNEDLAGGDLWPHPSYCCLSSLSISAARAISKSLRAFFGLVSARIFSYHSSRLRNSVGLRAFGS